MLVFHNDHLVPPELCWLLYQTIPTNYHAPVVFFNRPHPCDDLALGICWDKGRRIDICLNPLFSHARRQPTGSFAFSLWYKLLETCYHEFGHIATAYQCRDVSRERYWRNFRDFRCVEALAIDWAHRKLGELRDHDPSLAQPVNLGGYVGACLCQWLNSINALEAEEVRIIRIKEWRCRKTNTQMTPGDVLKALELSPERYPNAYRVLRLVSCDLGIPFIDSAGRTHKLYQ
jgi:hypothetical protein